MAMNPQWQKNFDRQINRMKEDGFFLPSKGSLAGNARYLFISYGGSGTSALFSIKKKLEITLPKEQLAESVRFLAIDTDTAAKQFTHKVRHPDGTTSIEVLDTLNNNQFALLDGRYGRMSLHDPAITEWINPTLKDRILYNRELLSGCSASGVRQLGRLTMYPGQAKAEITAKVAKLVRELTDHNNFPLHVFILSGISGGTGSGIVVDMTYLIRNIVDDILSTQGRAKYCGFLLLPPTGTSDNPFEINHGNRNGYAALKEITHFMNIRERADKYSFTYGDHSTVTSEKNIFDVCYLLDSTIRGMTFANPIEQVNMFLADSILSIICASQSIGFGNIIPTVDFFTNSMGAFTPGMVASNSIWHAVRDADYIYCSLGHSEFAMSRHEIKAYVAKQMFDRIHQLFLRCSNVGPEDVTALLKSVLRGGATTCAATATSMDAALWPLFAQCRGGKGGPYYVVNLLRDLAEEVRIQRSKTRLFRIGMASNQVLDNIENYALHVNNSTFSVFTAAMNALKSMMDEQFGVVVKGGINGNTYSFIPYHLSTGRIADEEYVIKHLDGLINTPTLRQLTEAMLQEMISNKAAWTALVSSDDLTAAPNAMRRFWNEQLDQIIDATLEDFLIKYYSADPDASYSLDTHEWTYPYLQKAANAIYQSMLGDSGTAQPMVDLTPIGLQPSDFHTHTFLMVPERARNLYNELVKIAAGAPKGQQVMVCTSTISDRISCFKQYTSIPAFKLYWACSAEQDYENNLKTSVGMGLHLSEASDNGSWQNFPNLLPKSCWHLAPIPNYANPREEALADQAAQLFDRSNALKLAIARRSVAGFDYDLMVLPKAYRPDDALFKDLDRCIKGSNLYEQKLAAIDANVEQCATALFSKVGAWQTDTQIPTDLANAGVAFETRALYFPNSVHSVSPVDERPENWDEYMAQCELRRLPNVMNEARGTVMVMEKLLAKVTQAI